jgi:basic membrane lipoprotein Med (substrate-binding protein (PBP1-ABC) superfamily)
VRGVSRKVWIAGGAVLLLAVVVVVLVTWPRERQLPPPRAREYRSVDACLLTGPAGITDTQAAAVWAGMQDASLAALARVSYLPVVGPETTANALPFAQSLIQRHCVVIVATGPVEVSALAELAPKHTDVRFLLIGGTGSGANVSTVPAGTREQIQPRVAEVLRGFLQ